MNIEDYLGKLRHRAAGFRSLFEILNEKAQREGPLILVETGCIRKLDAWESDGNSSILFDRFARATSSKFITIDIEPSHCRLAQQSCPDTVVLCGDSVASLYRLPDSPTHIDFLYLDSFDLDWRNPHPSALHHLKELCAAMPLLKPSSIVVVDDNARGIGKGMYVREFLEQIGARIFYDGYQIGFELSD